MAPPVEDARFAQLAALRAGIRRYLAWAEQRARDHGMTPAQVQLALAIRAHADPAGPTLTELAETLLLRHHSVVGLVDRAEHNGLVERRRDREHQTRVRVRLTAAGAERLETLSALHLDWLAEHGAEIGDVWRSFA
jgi:DNA-binding MarR family transcriptional regulator